MSGQRPHQRAGEEAQPGTAPAVDQGDPPSRFALLRRALAPTPERFGNALRLVVLVLICVSVSETFRLPEPALSAFIVLLVSRDERASTVTTALASALAVVLALLATIVVFMASLAEPALRLPLIALMTFVAMFLARTSPLGPLLFVAGFIIAYGLTLGDEVLGLALQPGLVGNTTESAIPLLVFMSPEEALLHFLLWLGLVVAFPAALVIVANLLTGRDPALLLRAALTERLEAAAQFCAGQPGADRRLAALAREGTAGLLKLHAASRPPHRRESGAVLIDQVSRLCLILLAASRQLAAATLAPDQLARAGIILREAQQAVQHGITLAPSAASALETDTTAVGWPLANELSQTVRAICTALTTPPIKQPGAAHAATAAKPETAHGLLAADAFSNPDNYRFALKVTLAVMLCYAFESLTNWPGIHTCVITCFFVSLGTVGETVHKATLRITGCLIGGALGIGTILLLMPAMTNLGDLLLVLAVMTFLAGWIGSGSERIGYAGWQIGLAFYLTVLQGNGPTLDMETARDRIIGILVGNIAVYIIFTTVWPVGVGSGVRAAIARSVEQLAALMALQTRPDTEAEAAESALRQAFGSAVAQARGLMVNDTYEPRRLHGRRPIDAAVLLDVQALMVPVSVILGLRDDPVWQQVPQPARQVVLAYHDAMVAWLRRCAAWVRSGTGGAELVATLPPPPEITSPPVTAAVAGHLVARATWYGLLHSDIRAILDQVAPRRQTMPPTRDAILVPA